MVEEFKGAVGEIGAMGVRNATMDFEVKHRKGSLHQFPDALSQMHEQVEIETAAFDEIRDPWYLRMLNAV